MPAGFHHHHLNFNYSATVHHHDCRSFHDDDDHDTLRDHIDDEPCNDDDCWGHKLDRANNPAFNDSASVESTGNVAGYRS